MYGTAIYALHTKQQEEEKIKQDLLHGRSQIPLESETNLELRELETWKARKKLPKKGLA